LPKNHPARSLLDTITKEPKTELHFNHQDHLTSKYEVLNACLDVLFRVFYYYDENLFPDDLEKEGQEKDKKITYSKIFKGALVIGCEEIKLKPYYILEDKFSNQIGGEYTCFDYFDDNDWENFKKGTHVYFNTNKGMGFDSVVFDKIDENHGKRILDALNQKYDKNVFP
jgi:hypothetical protein